MPLYGKNLSIGAQGDDVATLHDLLRRVGVDLPANEVEKHDFGRGTAVAVARYQKQAGLAPTSKADDATVKKIEKTLEDLGAGRPDRDPPGREPPPAPPDAEPSYVVRGQVMYRRGLPIAGVPVRAVHRALRRDVRLGRATTDERGEFSISYSVQELPKGAADLQVRAFPDEQTAEEGNADSAIAVSRVIYHARPLEKIRLRVNGGPESRWTEFQQLRAEASLHLDDATFEELREQPGQRDISLLAGKTNQPLKRLADLVVAHKIAATTGLEPEAAYGLVRRGGATDVLNLVTQEGDQLARAIRRAVDAGIAPGELLESADQIAPRLRQAAVRKAAEDPSALGGALSVLDNVEERETFLNELTALGIAPKNEANGEPAGPARSVSEFWADLEQDDRFAPKVRRLQLNLQLAAMTNSHDALVPILERRLSDVAGTGDRRAPVRALAALSADDFEAAINELPEGQRLPADFAIPTDFPVEAHADLPDDELSVKAYAATLAKIVAEAMPTTVLAYQAAADEARPAEVRRFWLNVATSDRDFELAAPLGSAGELDALLDGVGDRAVVLEELATVKRLFNVTADYGHLNVLRDAGLESAKAITDLGGETLIARYGEALGGPTQALAYAERASTISSASLALLTGYSGMFNNLDLAVAPAWKPTGRPNLETLFGGLDLCDCPECRSVLSPAAYLAELLAWLAERQLPDGRSARQVFFARRPDVGQIELTCANTNTRLPYIDLVNELLELVISPIPDVTLAAARATELDGNQVSVALRDAFAAAGTPLSDEHRAYVLAVDTEWFITDHSTLWAIKRTSPTELVAHFGSYQTGASDAELAAEAEHRRAEAYVPLRGARFPVGLPLDLPTHEVRTYLGHLVDTPAEGREATRAEIMRAMAPTGVDPDAALDIATDSLGLTEAEGQLVTGPTPADPWVDFGLAENNNQVRIYDPAAPGQMAEHALGWLDVLRQVRHVLDRSGLTYDKLVELLRTSYVNPDGGIRIESADASDVATCAIAKLVLVGFNAAAAIRLRRFTRLWTGLGWPIRELDDLIGVLRADEPDVNARVTDDLIVALAAVDRLRQRASIELAEMPGLWARLRTDRADAQYVRLYQNPEVLRPLDPAFDVDAGAAGGPELAIVAADPGNATIDLHTPTILAALAIDAVDLAKYRDALPNGTLNVANLSTLFRYARVARALELSADEMLALTELADNPFAAGVDGPPATLRFVRLVDQVRALGLTVAEIDYLLFHQGAAGASGAPTDDAVALALDDLRSGLRAIVDQTVPAPDPAGDRLAKTLAGLRWPAHLVVPIVEALQGPTGPATFSAALAALPAGLVVGAELTARFRHADGRLNVRGPLTVAERDALLAASNDGAYTAAVNAVFAAPRTLLSTYLKAYEWPPLRVALAAMPTGVTIPANLRPRLYYDAPAAQLVAKSPISEDDARGLTAISTDAQWRAAIAALLAAPLGYAPPTETAFLDAATVDALLDVAQDPADRIAAVFVPLLAYVRRTSSDRLMVQQLGRDMAISTRVMERLLNSELRSSANPADPAMTDFLDDAYAASDSDVAVTRAAFARQFDTFIRLSKVAQVVARLRLTTRELSWLADLSASVPARPVAWAAGVNARWWSPQATPVTPTARSAEPLAALLRLAELDRLHDSVSEAALDTILRSARAPGATRAALLTAFADAAVAAGYATDAAEMTTLADRLGLTGVDDFTDEAGMARLVVALRWLRRTGASAAQLVALSAAVPTDDDARTARQLVKAKYETDEWRRIAKPLRDQLRARQRTALVRYVLSHRELFAVPPPVVDQADLYGYLLIDSAMEPIVTTSRIKQAIGSVQLFVQRCFLNLEPDVVVDDAADPGWRDWAWMKNEQFWVGNRNVFCYPENWLEPALRDDKTPFFAELESALMQDDVTEEVAEEAFAGYLTQLAEVARLEILGIWDQPPVDGRPQTLHMFGRTRGKAPSYYHRTRINGAAWTAWRRVDVDIAEPQILPIVWNRQLYLFWPVLAEVTPEPTSAGDTPVIPTNKRFDLTLAYSRYHRGKWHTKQLTDLTVPLNLTPTAEPDRGKSRLVLHAGLPGAGGPELWIWPEWDDPQTTIATVGSPSVPGTPGVTNYAAVSGFRFTGADENVELFNNNIGGIYQPTGTVAKGALFVQSGGSPLKLPAELTGTSEGVALASAPHTFSIAYPHQDYFLSGTRTFVYQDGLKSYVVDPAAGKELIPVWVQPTMIEPSMFETLRDAYYMKSTSAAARSVAATRFRSSGNGAIFEPMASVEPVIDIVGHEGAAGMGTRSAIALARNWRETQQAIVVDALAIERDARLSAAQQDKRFIISKPDRSLISIADYIDDGRIIRGHWRWITRDVRRYVFRAGFHPYPHKFQQDLAVGGLERLLTRDSQLRNAAPFAGRYQPTALVNTPYPVEDVDFAADSTYQQYNWELFFHAPLLIATRLSANQRFEAAQRWFHFIFNPTDKTLGPTPARFWQTRPFYEQTQPEVLAQRIEQLLASLAGGNADPGLLQQVATWRATPFNPYAIARLRLPAFQKMVVMRYLDNLIAWGDQLFRRDTIESINYAAQLYVLAGEILGKRAELIPPRAEPQVRTAESLAADVDNFTEKLVQIEQQLGAPAPDAVVVPPDVPPLAWPKMLYFGVPRNERLLAYWDTVANRLFKIHNSMNIEGVVRQLPLFEPPIDPALLVRAAAAGVDLSTALADISAPAPHYRFRTLVSHALALAADVRSLGANLLAALEKRDAERLAVLRAGQERALADEVEKVRIRQEDDAKAQIAVLRTQREGAVQRYLHFQKLLGTSSPTPPPEDQPITLVEASANANVGSAEGVKLLAHEQSELGSLADSASDQQWAAGNQAAAGIFSIIPTVGGFVTPWGVGVTASWGGSNLAGAANAIGSVFTAMAAGAGFDASKSSRLAQAVVREHDWVLQSNVAAAEIMLIDRQRLTAEIRAEIAKAELANHRLTMGQALAVEEFLSEKFTSRELYDWMVGQSSALYFQAYQLAYDMAKQAERAMRRELALADSAYVTFGYWDNLRKGLLAGERLQLAIERMQSAYFEQDRRTYEITKHVSLAAVNPAALVDLRETGECYVQLPEAIFDLDRPGDYQRRIKMVSLTIPAVTGPYASVNCRLTLLSNQVRVSASTAGGHAPTGADDARFRFSTGGVTSIVTSSGRDDSGMFSPDLNDERFLPFEREGCISSWRLELPNEFRQFDYRSISDVILTIRYTALDGGDTLRTAALTALRNALQAMEVEQGRRGLYRLFSVRQDFPDAWWAMLNPPTGSTGPHRLTLPITADRFPFLYAGRNLRINRVAVFFKTAAFDDVDPFSVAVTPPGAAATTADVSVAGAELGGLPLATPALPAAGVPVGPATTWTVELSDVPTALTEDIDVDGTTVARLSDGALDDIGVLVHYTF